MCTVMVSITFQSRGLGSRHHSTNTCNDNSYYRYSTPRKTIFKYYLISCKCHVSDIWCISVIWCMSMFFLFFPSMHQDNCGYLCMIIQPALKEDAGWYTVSAKNDAGIVSSTARLDVHSKSKLSHTSPWIQHFPLYKLFKYFYSFFSSMAAA